MDRTEGHHAKLSKLGSEGQVLCVLPLMWKLDPKDKYIHTYQNIIKGLWVREWDRERQ
jgi:hypothetical protein